MRSPSWVSIASRLGSSRPSNRRENRLALAVVFMRQFPGRGRGPERCRWISKNAPGKATETVCMAKGGKRVAWVTGGGTGIGEAGAISLAADGWTVVVSGRRKDALDAVAGHIMEGGREAGAMGR